jgi:glutathione S-transferase
MMMMGNNGGFYPASFGSTPFIAFISTYSQDSPPVQAAIPSPYHSQYQQQIYQQAINGQSSDNESPFKLYDFDSNNQTEIIRLMFYFAGVSFKDKLVKQEEWEKVKKRIPVQQLPILRINDYIKIYYLNAIVRYLAREFNLYGTGSLDHAIVDIIFESNRIFQEKLFEQIKNSPNTEQRQTILTQFLNDHGIDHLNQLEGFYKIFNRPGPFYLGSEISLADLIVYQTINYFIDIQPQLLDNYPHLQQARHQLEKIPQLANYLNKKNLKIKRKRHATVSPTSRNVHNHHRHRSHDVHKTSHRHRSRQLTPPSPTQTNQESKPPIIILPDEKRSPSISSEGNRSSVILIEKRSSIVPSGEKRSLVIPIEQKRSHSISSESNRSAVVPNGKRSSIILSEKMRPPVIPMEEKRSPSISSNANRSPVIPTEENRSPVIPTEENRSPVILMEKRSSIIPIEEKRSLSISSEENRSFVIPMEEKKSPSISPVEKRSTSISPKENRSLTILSEENTSIFPQTIEVTPSVVTEKKSEHVDN